MVCPTRASKSSLSFVEPGSSWRHLTLCAPRSSLSEEQARVNVGFNEVEGGGGRVWYVLGGMGREYRLEVMEGENGVLLRERIDSIREGAGWVRRES